METKRTQLLERSIERYVIVLAILLCVNVGLLYFLRSQVKVISLLQGQLVQLRQDQQILASAEQIYQTYKNDIDTITAVFPDEESVLVFLQTLDDLAKSKSDTATVKFATFSPQQQGDKLYLLFTVNMRTDTTRLVSFLSELEALPYMTRLFDISITWIDSKQGIVDSSMKLKLYVKNPFATK